MALAKQMTRPQKRDLFSAFIVGFLDNFGYSLVFILFAPLILKPEYGFFSDQVLLGTKNILLGVLIGVFPVMMFFGAPLWGDFADRFGRKKALIITLLATIAGHLLSALAILTKSYALLLVARALAGFFSGNISICLATISDVSPTSPIKARNFGILTVLMGLGWISAMLVGGYLSDPSLGSFLGPTLPFYITALFTFLGFLVVRLIFTESHKTEKGVKFDLIKSIHEIKAALHTKQIRPFLLILLIWSLGWFFAFQWLTPISMETFKVSQQTTSLSLVGVGIFWVLGGVFLNTFLVKRFPSLSISLWTILTTALFLLLSQTTQNYLNFSIFYWIGTFAAPAALSNILNLVSSAAPKKIQGKAMGFTQSFQALAGVIVPLAGGLIAKIDIKLILPLSISLLLLSCLFLFFKRTSTAK
jgi:MFS transporter, DHA1 family, tetracycline resistance protein